MNANFTDMAQNGLSLVLPRDGQAPMTGQLPLAPGSVSAPALAWAVDVNTGLYRIGPDNFGAAVGGVKILDISATGLAITGSLSVTGTGWIVTANIADGAITNAKLADMANGTVKGRGTSGTGVPEDLTLGTGLVLSGTVLSAPAVPVPATYKNLAITVATNTTVALSADFVTTTDGTNYQTTPVSVTVNLGTTGANALDTGTIQTNTWYSIWVIAKADGTTAGLASIQATPNATFISNLPSGYTFYARVGWVSTINGSATLWGTRQRGNRTQYVLGLAQTTTLPNIGGVSGAGTFSASAPVWAAVTVQGNGFYVPTTASEIGILWTNVYANAAQRGLQVAPSDQYGGHASNNPPPLSLPTGGVAESGSLWFELEGSTIQWTSTGAGGVIQCLGWVDNI